MNRIKGWWRESALAIAFFLITLAAAKGWSAGVDEAVRDFFSGIQVQALRWIAIGLNLLGQGSILNWVLSLGLSIYLFWRRRDWRIFLPWATAYVLTYLITGPVKIWSMRDGPRSVLPNAVEFFNEQASYTMSYPSGHVVNAIVWWGVIVYLGSQVFPHLPRRLMRLAPPIIVFFTTLYLGYHWLTDNLGALAIGLFIERIMARLYYR